MGFSTRQAGCANCTHFSGDACGLGKAPDAEKNLCDSYEITDTFKNEIAKTLSKEIIKEHSLEIDVIKKT